MSTGARQILPGKLYEYPPAQKKIPFTKITREEILQLLTDPLQPGDAFSPVYRGFLPHWQKLWHPIFKCF